MNAATFTSADRQTADKRGKAWKRTISDAEFMKLCARTADARTDDLTDYEVAALARLISARMRRIGFHA